MWRGTWTAAFRRCLATCSIATTTARFELNEIVDPLTNNGGRCGMPAVLLQDHRIGTGRVDDAGRAPAGHPQARHLSIRIGCTLVLGGKRVELILPGKQPLRRCDGAVLSGGAGGVRHRVHQRRGVAGDGQSARVAERLRSVRRQSAVRVDQVVSHGGGARLRHLRRRTWRPGDEGRRDRSSASSSRSW